MTDNNKKENIFEEIERAKKAREAAQILFEKGLVMDAISRLYYCLLYHIRALLLSEGLEVRSHDGALRLFSLYFVKRGIFLPEDSHVFSRLMKYREEADYDPSSVFTDEDFQYLFQETETLTRKIKIFLKSKSYLDG